MNIHDTRFPATLAQLEQRDDFVGRHVGPDAAETRAMLDVLGLDSLDQLIDKVIPASILSAAPLALPEGRSEPETLALLRAIAGTNRVLRSFIGRATTTRTRRRSSCATCWRTRPGTPPTRRTSRRSRRAAWKRCSTSRP
jgi:hypothetical protein